MPTKKAAIKHLKQTKKRTVQNIVVKNRLDAAVKKSRKLIAEKKKAEAMEAVKQAVKALDKAAQNKLIKKNTASRTKSRLMKQLNKLS